MCGIPPLSGFIAKMWVYASLLDFHYYAVSVFLIVTGAFSAFYYIKVVKISFFENTVFDSFNTNHSIYRFSFFSLDCALYSFLLFLLFFLSFYPDFLLFFIKGLANPSHLSYASL